jgi:hypothetical protein
VTEVKKGDRVRVRRLGSNDDWCICGVVLVSPNGQSLALVPVDGAVHTERGGIVTGFIPVTVIGDNAYEVGTMTKLEMDRWRPQ